MNRPDFGSDPRLNYRVQGWGISAAVHTLAVGVAFALTSTLHQPPQSEPFKWEVSLVQPPVPQVIEPQPNQTPPMPKRAEPPVVERKPVVQTVQTVTHVVRQEIREVTPQVRPTVQPTQAVVTRQVESVNRTAETEVTAVQTAAATEAQQVITEPAPVVREETPVAAAPTPMSRQVVEQAPVPVHAPPVAERLSEPVQAATVERASAAVVTGTIQERQVLLAESAHPLISSPVSTTLVQERQHVQEPAPVATPTTPIQQASIHQLPAKSLPATKADYGWLAEALWNRVEQLKRYPHLARMNRWEGMVVLQAVIRHDGQLVDLKVAESSGHAVLDQDAMEVMRKACPLDLKHPLGRPQVVVQVPISYKLQ